MDGAACPVPLGGRSHSPTPTGPARGLHPCCVCRGVGLAMGGLKGSWGSSGLDVLVPKRPTTSPGACPVALPLPGLLPTSPAAKCPCGPSTHTHRGVTAGRKRPESACTGCPALGAGREPRSSPGPAPSITPAWFTSLHFTEILQKGKLRHGAGCPQGAGKICHVPSLSALLSAPGRVSPSHGHVPCVDHGPAPSSHPRRQAELPGGLLLGQ